MADVVSWDDKYLIGVKTVDNQHKQLFGHLNSFHESLSANKGKETVNNVLNNLIDYAVYHFAEEEKVMDSIKGTNFLSHFEEHISFCAKVSELKAKVFLGEEISYELFDFVKDWLVNHIMLSDQKIGEAYNKNM